MVRDTYMHRFRNVTVKRNRELSFCVGGILVYFQDASAQLAVQSCGRTEHGTGTHRVGKHILDLRHAETRRMQKLEQQYPRIRFRCDSGYVYPSLGRRAITRGCLLHGTVEDPACVGKHAHAALHSRQCAGQQSFQFRQQAVAQTVAAAIQFQICTVHNKIQTSIIQISLNLRTGAVKQRPYNMVAAIAHTRKPGYAAAPCEIQEESLDIILPMMPHGYIAGA